MTELPEYTDGEFNLFKIEDDESSDFPVKRLVDQELSLCYREIAVFDRLRYEFDQGDKEITMKIRIPRCKEIDSTYAVEIDGQIHIVYNAAHVTDKHGFPETELTLIKPEKGLLIE